MDKRTKLKLTDPVDITLKANEDSTEWTFEFPDYNKAAIDALKLEIPKTARSYNPDTYEWTVSEKYLEQLEDVLLRTWPNAEVWYEE